MSDPPALHHQPHLRLLILLYYVLKIKHLEQLNRSDNSSGSESAPRVRCPSELQGEAGADRQALVHRSDSHRGLYVESGGSPSGSRKGFMDKTRVISLSDSGLGGKKQRKSFLIIRPFFIHTYIHTVSWRPEKPNNDIP